MMKMELLIAALLLTGPVLAWGPRHASEENTRGWQFMTPEERIEHQSRIRRFTSYEECHAYQASHHRMMEDRARKRGMELPIGGRDICEHVKTGTVTR